MANNGTIDPLAKVTTAITQCVMYFHCFLYRLTVGPFPLLLPSYAYRNNAPWGLQRISQRAAIQDGNAAQTNFDYTYDDSAGRGVDIYIVDTVRA